ISSLVKRSCLYEKAIGKFRSTHLDRSRFARPAGAVWRRTALLLAVRAENLQSVTRSRRLLRDHPLPHRRCAGTREPADAGSRARSRYLMEDYKRREDHHLSTARWAGFLQRQPF